MAKPNWIKKVGMKKGALHEQMGVPQDQPIPADQLEEAAEQGGTLGKRARFAQTLESFHKKKSPFSKVKIGGK